MTQKYTIDNNSFGGFSIEKQLFDAIRRNLAEGSTLVELGSGKATAELIKLYKVYSVEHNMKYYKKYHDNYIYAPIIDGWYDPYAIQANLPDKYDALLIDGPTGKIGRGGFIDHIDIFKPNILYIFDDINRDVEFTVFKEFCKIKNLNYKDLLSYPYVGRGDKKDYALIDLRCV